MAWVERLQQTSGRYRLAQGEDDARFAVEVALYGCAFDSRYAREGALHLHQPLEAGHRRDNQRQPFAVGRECGLRLFRRRRWLLCFFDGDGYGRAARLQHCARKIVEAVLEMLQRPRQRGDLLRQEAAVLLHAVERVFGLLAGGASR